MGQLIKILAFTFFAIIFLVAILIFLQNLNIESVADQKINTNAKIHASLGETCSTPAFTINCKENLTCATNKNISDFNPSIETARCIPTLYVVDLNSKVWKK